jgi:peptidyl-dipeptidase Dcp
MIDNPFFEAWTTPFGLPPFRHIRPEHFPPAFERAMMEESNEISLIAALPETPTFTNTVEAMERSGRSLKRVEKVFFNLNASCTSNELEAIARHWAPELARHQLRIAHNAKLFERFADLHARRTRLLLELDQLRLIERRYLDFVRSGALLPAEQKRRLSAICERLATLQTLFAQNVLHDESEWRLVLGEEDLDGLPSFLRAAAAHTARDRGLQGRYVITLGRSVVEAFLTFSARRDLRQIAFEAWSQRGARAGANDNRPLIREILMLRSEQAALLGYENYAAFKLDDSMAKRAEAIDELLRQVWNAGKLQVCIELARLRQLAGAEGVNGDLEPWDWRYYAEKVKQATYHVDAAEMKEYFVLDNIVSAAFDTAARLFGLSFTERTDLALYHPDVRAYEVQDQHGRHVGLFLQDNFARPGKRSGAWMSSFRVQESFAEVVSPIVVNNNNFSKANPTLLSFDDARTLFHEFGHGLHGLLSRVRYPTQSGTAVRQDFVEFPSQMFEHWIHEPDILRKHARHFETGEPIPEALLQRLLESRTFNQGFGAVEYTAAALLDLEFHRHPTPDMIDVDKFERDALAALEMPAEIAIRHRPAHFQHLFASNDYAGAYYAYLWAESLDADGYQSFREAGDPFNPMLAARLKTIYSSGDSRDAKELYAAFRGREPTTEALLRQRGLVAGSVRSTDTADSSACGPVSAPRSSTPSARSFATTFAALIKP